MENLIKMDDLGVPLFWKPPYLPNDKNQGLETVCLSDVRFEFLTLNERPDILRSSMVIQKKHPCLQQDSKPQESGELKSLQQFKSQPRVRFYVNWLTSLMWMVTAGHEQMGAVEVYAQDVSWTSFKWLEGQFESKCAKTVCFGYMRGLYYPAMWGFK